MKGNFNRTYLLLLFYFFCICASVTNAQDSTSIKVAFQKDTSAIETFQFDKEALNQYRNSPVYTYDNEKIESEGFFSTLWKKFVSQFRKLFGDTGSSILIRIIFWILVVVGLGLLISHLLGVKMTSFFRRSSPKLEIHLEEEIEDVRTANFEERIKQAIEQRNYRLATRLLFLQTLKTLDHKDKIEWRSYKTNQNYIHELKGVSLHKEFEHLVRMYEYVWYGNFEIEVDQYGLIQKDFESFKSIAI